MKNICLVCGDEVIILPCYRDLQYSYAWIASMMVMPTGKDFLF